MSYYILVNKKPVKTDGIKWSQWYEACLHNDGRRVALTNIDESTFVSTVFLSIDHDFSFQGPPILFESMVFKNGIGTDDIKRYHTWEEAEKGHQEIVDRIRAGK